MRSAFISVRGTYRKECMYEVGLYFTEDTYRKECMYEVGLYFTERYLQKGMHV